MGAHLFGATHALAMNQRDMSITRFFGVKYVLLKNVALILLGIHKLLITSCFLVLTFKLASPTFLPVVVVLATNSFSGPPVPFGIHVFLLSSPRAKRRACALRALGLLLYSRIPQWEGGRLFDRSAGFFFYGNSCNSGT